MAIMTVTTIWQVNQQFNNLNKLNEHELDSTAMSMRQAADLLKAGELVAFPTETVYGLGADARSSKAVAGIFEAKGRPSDNPLIVHIAAIDQLDELVLPYPPLARELMRAFWPGPLTIVLLARPHVLSPLVTAGLDTVGIRMPDHPVALELLKLAGCPVAAPSANRSGRPSPTLASHVLEDLEGRISGIIDGGPTGVGLESTVVELADDETIHILRPGGVTEEQLRIACPEAKVTKEGSGGDAADQPRSPGMKYAHYAPKGELIVVQGRPEDVVAFITSQAAAASSIGWKTGVLAFSERMAQYKADVVLDCGSETQLQEAAHRLYACLRQFDEAEVARIWAEACSEEGIGGALMNRMAKAAGGHVVKV